MNVSRTKNIGFWAKQLHHGFLKPRFGSLLCASEARPELCGMEYVHSAFDFAVLTISHIERLAQLAAYLCKHRPEFALGLSPILVAQGLRDFHDREKWDASIEFVATAGIEMDNHPFNFLLANYGLDIMDRTPIHEMNNAGLIIRTLYLRNFGMMTESGLLTPMGERFVRIERIVDLVDTGLSPERREELGCKPVGCDMLTDADEIAAARFLMDHYEAITREYRFAEMKNDLWILLLQREQSKLVPAIQERLRA